MKDTCFTQSLLLSICSAGRVDVSNVIQGMVSACAPLSHRLGNPLMGTHCHGDGDDPALAL